MEPVVAFPVSIMGRCLLIGKPFFFSDTFLFVVAGFILMFLKLYTQYSKIFLEMK